MPCNIVQDLCPNIYSVVNDQNETRQDGSFCGVIVTGESKSA